MNKRRIIDHIIATLTSELAACERSARSAHEEATSEQSKAENKYDTRGLEASYLAQGQSRQAAEILQAITDFTRLPLRDFAPDDPIQPGALIELERGSIRTLYFLGPRAGGTEITVAGRELLVITPQSPLGRQLIGLSQGTRLTVGPDTARISAVH